MVAFASTRRASSRRGVGVAVQSVTKRRLALGPDDDARRRASAASPRSRPALVGGGARQRRTRARAPAHHPGRDSAPIDVVHRGNTQGNAREHLRVTLVRQTRRPGTEEVRARRRPVGRPRGGTGRGARGKTRVARPRRGLAYASTPRMSLPGTPRSPLVGAPANVAETLAVAAAAGDVSALNVADATVTGTPAECAELGANRCSESYQFVPLPVARNARNASSRNSSPSAAPGIATKIERGVATSGYEALAAYGDEGIRRLESSVVRWLHAMGLLSDDALAGSFATLCPELSKGTLLCDLVAAIEGIPVVGVFRPPKSVATARANVRRACERLARHRGMCRRHLFDHDEIVAGSPGAVLALLEDVRVFYDGHPPRTSAKHWNENVPYCPEMGMGRPPPGRDTNPPPRSPGRVLDPMRAMERGDDEDRDEDPDDDVHLDDEDAFGSDSEPARGSRDRSDDRSNDRDPSLVGSPPGIRDGAHPHPRSPPSDPTATPPPPARPFVSARASVRSRVPRVPRVPPSSRRPRSRRLATRRRRWKVGARPWWRRWTARRTVRIIRRYLRVRRASARWFARARGRRRVSLEPAPAPRRLRRAARSVRRRRRRRRWRRTTRPLANAKRRRDDAWTSATPRRRVVEKKRRERIGGSGPGSTPPPPRARRGGGTRQKTRRGGARQG